MGTGRGTGPNRHGLAGDNGSAGCDNDNSEEFAIDGQAVSGFASTPYNVAVGGTDFFYSDYATGGASISNYWNTTTSQLPAVSIKQYIPEQPWNDGPYGFDIFNQFAEDGSTSIAGGSGGASNCATGTYNSSGQTTACSAGYPKPSWQSGTGVPGDGVRDLPDVSLFSANGYNYSFYPICATDGDCQTAGLGAGDVVQIYGVGGTSASSPAFAGIMALVVEENGRQGQADNILYALKTQYPAAFHDVTVGSNSVPCELSPSPTPNCISAGSKGVVLQGTLTEGEIGTGTTPEYNAAAGYNLATGLGTIDAYNLVTDWSKIKLASTATTMTASQTSFAHGNPITITGTVTGTGPTGNVALMTDSTESVNQGQTVFSLSGGSYTSATSYPSGINFLPGGTYHIWGQYGGDSNNGMSTSTPPIEITVTPETPGMDLNLFNAVLGEYYTSASNPGTSVDYGSQLMLSALVAPTSQVANLQSCITLGTNCASLIYSSPTGTVTFTDSSNPINTAAVNAEGDAEYNAPFAVGAHSVSATYNGDQSYNKVTAPAPIAFTVVKDSPEFFFGVPNENSSGQIISGQPTVFNIIAENGAQYNVYSETRESAIAPVPVLPPTGTVTLSSTPAGFTGSASLSAGVDPTDGAQAGIGAITLPSLTPGSYTVSINYSGDSNYSGGIVTSATNGIVVVAGSGLTPSVTSAGIVGAISPNSTITINGTVTGGGTTAPTGMVYFFTSGYDLGFIPLTPGAGNVSTFTATISSQSILQGANFITLEYSGDAHYAPSEFTLNGGSPIPNPESDFTLVPDTTIVPVSVSAGASSGTDTINVASVSGFSGNVKLTCAATTPVTCSVSSPVALSNQSSTTATLTINVPAGTANGNYNVLVTGADAATGEFIHTLAITAAVTGGSPAITLTNSGDITVVQGATTGNTSTITVTPSGGFTGDVNLTCTVASPAGTANPVTCSASNFSLTPVDITSTSFVTSTLTVNTSATTTEGTYVITVVGTSGSITSATDVTVNVNLPQDFSLSNSGAIAVGAGANTGDTSTIAVTPLNGFSNTVNLTCLVTTAPPGAANPLTCGASNLNPNSVTPPGTTTSVLTASTTATTTTGAYVITVTGAFGTDTHTTTVAVNVSAAATSTYTVSATSPSGSISPGTQATSTITVQANGGYTGSVTLTCIESTGPENEMGDSPPCDISYSSGSAITVNGVTTSGQATATIVTVPASVSALVKPSLGNGKGWLGAGSGAVFAVLIFFGIPARRRSWRSMLGIIVAMAVIGVLSSCGGSGGGSGGGGGTNPTNPGTAAGSYTFTVTSSSTNPVTPAPTTAFTVSVN